MDGRHLRHRPCALGWQAHHIGLLDWYRSPTKCKKDGSCDIYMSTRKLDYYLDEAVTTIRSDHLPLKRFLEHKTKNSKVDNWSLDIAHYNLQFKYVKGIKNTLADTMSRLVQLDPAIKQEPEPEGYQFGQPHKKEPAEEVVATIQEGMGSKNELIPPDPKIM